MARKDKSLSGFGDVAKINENENNNVNTNTNNNNKKHINKNIDNNVNVNNNDNEDDDFIDQLLVGKGKKSDNTVLTGIYIKKDLARVLDNLAKKGGKGTKSRLVNDALRKVFEEKGLL